MRTMATMGPTTQRHVERLAGNLLRRARAQKGMTQRQLAELAGIPQSSIAKIESGARQPTLPVLTRILVAVDLEPRIALEAYDDHDDVLDAVDAGRNVDEREAAVGSVDNLIEALRNG
jgi:transcriptional regulator with XRE-family HTH domain